MKRKYYITAFLLTVVAVVIAIFSYNTVWLGDDINYAFNFQPEHRNETVSSFTEIISSLNEHYLTTNGRYVPHVFVQAFCGIWGHTAFAIANSIVYVAFMILLCRLCRVKMDNSKGVFTIVLFSLIVFQTKMVPSCQIGYIWTSTLTMIFLLLFFSKRMANNWWQILLIGIVSLIAGNGNEALNIGVSGALIIYWIMNARKMTLLQYVMMICFGLGTMAICLSPAAYSRATRTIDNSIFGIYTSVTYMFLTLKASFVMLAILLWKVYHDKEKLRVIYKSESFYFNIWIIMILFNIIIGFGANRQVFGAELAAIIISVRLLKHHSFNRLWLSMGTVVLILLYIAQYQLVSTVKDYYNEIERQYAGSTDGNVYIDINQENHVPYSMEFVQPLPLYGVSGAYGLYEHNMLNKWLLLKYPNRGDLRILPRIMHNYDNSRHGSLIHELSQKGLYLVVKSDNDNLKPYVSKIIDKPYLHKEYEPTEIDMQYCTLCSGNGWSARYVYLPEYSVMGLTDDKLYLR